MKRIFLSFTLVGILSSSLVAFAQTTPSAPDPSPAAPPPAAQEVPAVAQVPPPDVAPPATTPASEPTPIDTAKDTALQPGVLIPLIVMDDVPLTDAIRNLARQAAINHMLDPKIAYGQVGQDGKVTPQPSVSIRWENISAEQALTALLNNYGLQIIEDPKSKIARVTVKDPAAPPPLFTKIIQLKYTGPSNVLASVHALFADPKRSKVMADVRTSQLVVVATEKELVAVDELILRLDTQTKQVLIEARILETTVNPTTKKGVDWTGTLDNQHISVGNNLQQNDPSASVNNTLSQNFPKMLLDTAKGFNPATAFLDADGVNATLSFLNTYAEVKEISTPRTVTADNEKASIEVGELFPIVNVSAGTANTTGGSQITYSNLTIRLEVTPRISANDYVNLLVTPSITKLGRDVKTVVAGSASVVNSFLTRNMNTHVMIPSGNTLVMGGLIQDQSNAGNTKVPLLGDIPVLGYLFRTDSKARSTTDLILFITPTIVQDQDYQSTKTDYLKTPVPKNDHLEGDWTAWDSGKPKDWSKKAAKPEYQDLGSGTK
jgi:type II secretory pathway component HofQ